MIAQSKTWAALFAGCLLVGMAGRVSAQAVTPDASPHAWRGMAVPSKQVTLDAPVDGIIKTINVVEGQAVHHGDLLIAMDSRVQKAVVEAAHLKAAVTADRQSAKLKLADAQINLDRLIEAEQKHAAQPWEVRSAKLKRDIARVALTEANENHQLAESQLHLEQQRLSRNALTAPWDGQIVRVKIKPGATLSRRDEVLKLVCLKKLEAEIYLPADRYNQVHVNRFYTLAAGPPVNHPIVAKLRFASPVLDPASQTFRCVFTIDNAARKLPAGFVVQLNDLKPVVASADAAHRSRPAKPSCSSSQSS